MGRRCHRIHFDLGMSEKTLRDTPGPTTIRTSCGGPLIGSSGSSNDRGRALAASNAERLTGPDESSAKCLKANGGPGRTRITPRRSFISITYRADLGLHTNKKTNKGWLVPTPDRRLRLHYHYAKQPLNLAQVLEIPPRALPNACWHRSGSLKLSGSQSSWR